MKSQPNTTRTSARHFLWVLGISIAVYLVLALVQASAKRPWSDEGWFASPAFNLAYHGFMGTTVLYNPNLPRIQEHTYWILPLYLVSLAAWFKVTGFGLVSMRMLSAVFGAVAIGSWYAVAQKLTREPLIAATTAVLLSTDYLFVNIGTLGRPDMMCAGWGSLALALYLSLREHGLRRAFLWANVAMACCFFTHPNAILYAALFVLLLWVYDRKNLRIPTLVLGALPYLAGAAMWLVYIAKDPSAFHAQLTDNADERGRFGNFLHPLMAIKAEIVDRYATAYGLGPHGAGHTGPILLKFFVLACYVAAILICLLVPSIRVRAGTKLVLTMLGSVFVIQCFFNQKLSWYLAHIVPLYTLVLAVALVAIWRRGRFLRAGATVILLALLGVQVGGSLYLAKTNTYRKQYAPLVAFLNQLPAHQSIYGSAAIEFGLRHRERLLDDVSLGYYTHREPSYVVMDPIYANALLGLKYHHPVIYEAGQAKLKSARKVYDQDGFQVYALQ